MNTNLTDRPQPGTEIGFCPVCGRTLEVYRDEIEIDYTPKRHRFNPSAPAEARYAMADVVSCPAHDTYTDYPTSTNAEDHPAWYEIDAIYTAIEAATPHSASRLAIATMIADADAIQSPRRLRNLAGALHFQAEWHRASSAAEAARMYRAAAGACEDLAAYFEDFPNRDDAEAEANPAA